MSCTCAQTDPMVDAFDHFWPKGMPFPPVMPWLGAMFNRQSLFRGAAGGRAAPRPVEDGVVAEEENPVQGNPTPAEDGVVEREEGASGPARPAGQLIGATDPFGNVMVIPAPQGVHSKYVGKPAVWISRKEYDFVAGGSPILQNLSIQEVIRTLGPEMPLEQVRDTVAKIVRGTAGLNWNWLLIIRYDRGHFAVVWYDESGAPQGAADPWEPPPEETGSPPNDDPPSEDPSESLEFPEEERDIDDSYESPFKTDWGEQGKNQKELEDSDDEGDDSIFFDPCRRYPEMCHGIRMMLQNYVRWSRVEYQWSPVI